MKVRYTPKALKDLQNIRESVLEKFESEELAEKILKKITTSINDLEIFPYKGAELALTLGINTDYRSLFVQKNYVFYRLDKENVSIVRILNEKQDYMRILFGIVEVEDEE